jgi:hypothetical protein
MIDFVYQTLSGKSSLFSLVYIPLTTKGENVLIISYSLVSSLREQLFYLGDTIHTCFFVCVVYIMHVYTPMIYPLRPTYVPRRVS